MNKVLSLAILAGGIVLIIFGVNSSNSFGSSVSRTFTGAPTDKAIWMLVGGIILAVIGVAGTFLGRKSPKI